MELKDYQKHVITDIADYVSALETTGGIKAAWNKFWGDKNIRVSSWDGVEGYHDEIVGVPNVTIKVPTGGGKTFLAANAIRTIFDNLAPAKHKFVMWLVPSDSILTQTVVALQNPEHPYRQKLNADFGGRVNVYTKEQLLNGQSFSPDEVMGNLSVCVFCNASIRVNPKKQDDRKIYQENGNLDKFAKYFNDRDLLLAETPESALIQVIRQLRPVVIVDESHNVKSDLSIEMLKNINPSFILSMTATPAKKANIISYVNARELKKANMVKLPVIVYNRPDMKSVICDAVQLRGNLEAKAKVEEANGGAYIRPIVLFQAQPKASEDATTFEKIKKRLVEMGIPEGEIAIKTSQKDEIGATNLMSRECPIRYVITVNALKEGWDCPFAYILASLANKTSTVDVEQIVGRVLRQPYASKHTSNLLNMSYVLSSSNDFQSTVKSVAAGLNGAGFSSKDYRVAEEVPRVEDKPTVSSPELDFSTHDEPSQEEDVLSEIPEDATVNADYQAVDTSSIIELTTQAESQSATYEALELQSDYVPGTEVPTVKSYKMNQAFADEAAALRIPQFVLKESAGMFGEDEELLDPAELSHGFKLESQDATINYAAVLQGAVSVDISENGDVMPKTKSLSKAELEYFAGQLSGKTTEERLRKIADVVAGIVDRSFDCCTLSEIQDYVRRAIDGLSTSEKDNLNEDSVVALANVVKAKVESLEKKYRKEMFERKLNANEIVPKDCYALPSAIAPGAANTIIDKSLYEGEYDDMNDEEIGLITAVSGLPSVKWWHRIRDRKGFCINGFKKHYPDFMILTHSGNVVMVEVKGAHLDGSDSQDKLDLGTTWAAVAGTRYKYFMVFKDGAPGIEKALKQSDFLNTLERL